MKCVLIQMLRRRFVIAVVFASDSHLLVSAKLQPCSHISLPHWVLRQLSHRIVFHRLFHFYHNTFHRFYHLWSQLFAFGCCTAHTSGRAALFAPDFFTFFPFFFFVWSICSSPISIGGCTSLLNWWFHSKFCQLRFRSFVLSSDDVLLGNHLIKPCWLFFNVLIFFVLLDFFHMKNFIYFCLILSQSFSSHFLGDPKSAFSTLFHTTQSGTFQNGHTREGRCLAFRVVIWPKSSCEFSIPAFVKQIGRGSLRLVTTSVSELCGPGRGSHTTARELQTRTFERPGASNTTKIPRENPQREKKEWNFRWERAKKARNFGLPTPPGPHQKKIGQMRSGQIQSKNWPNSAK